MLIVVIVLRKLLCRNLKGGDMLLWVLFLSFIVDGLFVSRSVGKMVWNIRFVLLVVLIGKW